MDLPPERRLDGPRVVPRPSCRRTWSAAKRLATLRRGRPPRPDPGAGLVSWPAVVERKRIRVGPHSLAVSIHGRGPTTAVLLHGNSCSSRCYGRQLESGLVDRFRLIAIDLPGHGESSPAVDPDKTYTLPGYAETLVAAASELGAENAVFVGWSLGGYAVLEALPNLPRAAGFLIFGAVPIASNADLPRALSSDPVVQAGFRADSTDEELRAVIAMFFRPGFVGAPFFFEDFRRTDKRARVALAASVARNELRDEMRILRETTQPFAVVHGAHDVLALRSGFVPGSMTTLWRGEIQEIADAGHAPQWETPEAFNRILQDFVLDCAGSR
jgi:pimeloyl-ACP methyl ester carboxylesterase